MTLLEILPSPSSLGAFALASFVLAVTPGPGVVFIVTRTLVDGSRSGFASVAGVALGNLGNAIAAAFGLAFVFAVSALAFSIVKLAGAAYLIYLGVRLICGTARQAVTRLPDPSPSSRAFADGFLVALLNPKTAIFFAAFLPQFTSQQHALLPQSIRLGALFVAIALVTDAVYVLAAARMQSRLARLGGMTAAARYLAGGIFVSLGFAVAIGGARAAR
jgi:threonine/homoserine/homoserine lactone efflux protein